MSMKFYAKHNEWFDPTEPIIVDGVHTLHKHTDTPVITIAVDASISHNEPKTPQTAQHHTATIAAVCEELGLTAHAVVHTNKTKAELAAFILGCELLINVIAPRLTISTVIFVTDQSSIVAYWGSHALNSFKKRKTTLTSVTCYEYRKKIHELIPQTNILVADTISHTKYEHTGHIQADKIASKRRTNQQPNTQHTTSSMSSDTQTDPTNPTRISIVDLTSNPSPILDHTLVIKCLLSTGETEIQHFTVTPGNKSDADYFIEELDYQINQHSTTAIYHQKNYEVQHTRDDRHYRVYHTIIENRPITMPISQLNKRLIKIRKQAVMLKYPK